MRFAYTTILNAPRFGWQPIPSSAERLALYRLVREMGFEGIEWSPRWCDVTRSNEEEVRRWSGEVLDGGLVVAAINLNRCMLSQCAEAGENRIRLAAAIPAASLLQSDRVIVSLSYPQPPTDTRAAIHGNCVSDAEFTETAQFLKTIARKADSQGIELVLELHDDGLLDSSSQCLRMLELIDEPNVALNPDLGNLIRQPSPSESWQEALARLAPHAGYWHVKNYVDEKPTPVWEGDVDYNEAFRMMREVGFAGWVSIESYFGDERMRLQQESLDWLRRLWTEVPA